MKTSTNIESRRMSMTGYQTILKNRESREAQEQIIKDEENRKNMEDRADNAQKTINDQCKEIQNSFAQLVQSGKDMQQMQDQLAEKEQEEELFRSTADEVYTLTDLEEKDVHKMKFRKGAYYALPILDCIFAFFALYPIMTSKLAEASRWGEAMVIPIGFALSAGIGYGLSLLSRVGVSSLDDGDKSSPMYILKKLAIGLSMFSLPLMYLIGEACYSSWETWTYSLCFAIVSFVIQLLIVSGYKNQIAALDYFRIKEQNEKAKAARAHDEKAIQGEIQAIKGKMQSIIEAFNAEYTKFRNKFTELAATRREYINQFAKEPEIYLNQLTIFFGNLVCFRRMEIPFYREENGTISAIPVIEFPYVVGGHEIAKNVDILYIDYMLKATYSGISLSETIRMVKEGYQKKLSTFSEAAQANPISTDAENEPDDDENEDGIW